MAKFCEFCGKPTNNGVCDCPEYIASIGANSVSSSGDPQQTNPMNYQQYAQQNAPTPPHGNTVPFTEASKNQIVQSKKLFIEFVKNPFKMIAEINRIDDKVSPIIFGILHVVIIYLYIYLKMEPSTDEMKSLVSKFSAKIAVILFAITFVLSAVTYFVAKKYDDKIVYRDILSVFFVATIPSSIMLIASFVAGYIVSELSVLLLFMAFVSWIIMSFIGIQECVKTDKNVVFWIYLAIFAIVISIAVYIIQKNVSSMMTDFFSDLNLDFMSGAEEMETDYDEDLY